MITKNFHMDEFRCKCCGEYRASDALLILLQAVREYFGVPVIVNSGYRCKTHNAEVGGELGSRHMKGDAADIMVVGIPSMLVYEFIDENFGNLVGLAVINERANHVDTRGFRARWTYPRGKGVTHGR